MTDHRPEVREALEKALYCIEVQNMHSYDEQPDVETAIANGYWCKMAMDARSTIKAALTDIPDGPQFVAPKITTNRKQCSERTRTRYFNESKFHTAVDQLTAHLFSYTHDRDARRCHDDIKAVLLNFVDIIKAEQPAPPAHQSMREALELCGGLKQPHECSRYHEWVSLVDKGQCNKTFTHWNLDAALSAPPVEPQGVRACLMEGVVLVSKTMLLPNTRDIHAWADKAKAALAACAPKGECGK